MKRIVVWLALAGFAAGCQNEPTTLREEAERAQENLETARERAAELIAESEEDAVDTLADAREKARENIQDAKQEANQIVVDAQQNLELKLDQLSDKPEIVTTEAVEVAPAAEPIADPVVVRVEEE